MYKGGKKILLIIGIVIGLAIHPILLCMIYFSAAPQDASDSASASVFSSIEDSAKSTDKENKDTPEDDNLPYARGILTETTFESQWLDMRFTCPEDLIMQTQEELDLGLTDENGDLLKNTGFTNELGVYDVDASFYLSLTVEDPFTDDMTVQEYFDFLISNFSDEPGAYQFSDLTETREIGSLMFQKLSISSVDEGGIPFHNDYYITYKDEKFVVINTYYFDDAAHYSEESLNAFRSY